MEPYVLQFGKSSLKFTLYKNPDLPQGALVKGNSMRVGFKNYVVPQTVEFQHLATGDKKTWIKIMKLDQYKVEEFPVEKTLNYRGEVFKLDINYLYKYSGFQTLVRKDKLIIRACHGQSPSVKPGRVLETLKPGEFWSVAKPLDGTFFWKGNQVYVYQAMPIKKNRGNVSLVKCRIEQGP